MGSRICSLDDGVTNMHVWKKFSVWIVVILLTSLMLVVSVLVNASTTVDEITVLAFTTKENLAALDVEAKQADADLKIVANNVNTRLAEFNLSTSKTIESINDLAREDRQAARLTKAQALLSAELKLQADNQAIEQGLKEAAEKAEKVMAIAEMQLYLGTVNSLLTVSGAANTLTQGDSSGFSNLLRSNVPNLNLEVLEIRRDIGITVRVRVGKGISCLSSKQQCSGRSYLISR